MSADFDKADRSVTRLSANVQRSGNEIDHYSGRLRLVADTAAILGPAGLTIAATAVPAVTALANQLGVAALAGGTAILAFQGVGGALKALNDYQLAPTDAHLQTLHQKMAALGPAGREFVRQLQALRPELQHLQDMAQAGLFPGLTDAISVLQQRLPDVEQLLATISRTLGDLSVDAAKALAGPEWDDFFNMLENEARPTLIETGHALGDVAAGLADLWTAFAPLNQDFARGLADMAKSFHDWAAGLSQTEGFTNFVDYLRTEGPRVLDTLGSLAGALVDIGRAAAPLGGPALEVVKAFADAISAIARSDLGTPIFGAIAALSAYNRALGTAQTLQGSVFATKLLPRFKAALTPIISDVGAIGTTWLTAGAKSEREITRVSSATQRLSAVMKGAFIGGGVVVGIGLITDALNDLTGQRLDLENLDRSLQSLSHGVVAGELFSKYGNDLSGFGNEVQLVTGKVGFLSQQAAKLPGALGDFLSSPPWTEGPKDAAENIKGLDEALAGLVESGQRAEAAAVFRQLQAAATMAGVSVKDFTKQFPQYRVAVENATATAKRNVDTAVAGARSYDRWTESIKANLQAMKSRKAAQLAANNAEIAYQQALDDARKALTQNGATLDLTTQKGRDNMTALNAIAAGWNGLSDKQKNAHGAFAQARQDLIDQAIKFGATRKEAERYAEQLLEIPPKVATKVLADTDGAFANIRAFKRYMDSLHDKTITLHLKNIQENGPIAGGGHLAPLRGFTSAAGNLFAAGDVANGHQPQIAPAGAMRIWAEPETKGEAYIPLADDWRRPRAVDIWERTGQALGVQFARFAGGGMTRTVTVSPQSSAGAGIDYGRLARAVAAVRPLYGDVHLQPHDYNAFKREMLADQQRAGLGVMES